MASAVPSGTWNEGTRACSAAVQVVALQAMPTKLAGLADEGTLPTMTAVAPADLAFCTLTAKPHVPRSTKAILPATGEVITVQPSAGTVETTSPPRVNDCGPNTATPTP